MAVLMSACRADANSRAPPASDANWHVRGNGVVAAKFHRIACENKADIMRLIFALFLSVLSVGAQPVLHFDCPDFAEHL